MGSKRGPLGLLALTAAFFVFAFGASSAQAEFGIAEWEALTCKENVDIPAAPGLPPLAQSPEQCTDSTPEKFFTQASGHPPFGITDFSLNSLAGFEGFPDGFVEHIRVELPEGLNVNPEAAPKCTIEEMETNPVAECPDAIVGTNYFTVAVKAPTSGECPPGLPPAKCPQARPAVPVFNVVPFVGVPSMVAFPTTTGTTYIVGSLDPVDQHVNFDISDIESPAEVVGAPPVAGSRLVFNGAGGTFGNGTYLTMPSNCAGGQTTLIHVDSHEGSEDSASYTTSVGADECASSPFEPDLDTSASGSTGSPGPASVDVQMPNQLEPEKRANSHLLTAKVTLPEGAGLNPSIANGLNACSDEQFKKGTNDPVECPASSRIGSIDVETPALDQDLGGDLYVAQPKSNNPSSGEQFRVFLHAYNDRYGVNVRLEGKVFPDLDTGQLTVLVPDNPQAPFSSFKVNVDGGARGALTSPETCGPNTTTATFTPWADNGNQTRKADFTLDTAGYGGPCPKTLADRRLAPGYLAAPETDKAGAFTPFRVNLFRADGEQEIKRIDVDLPPGMVASLKGVDYCPQVNIDTAGALSGTATTASPPCPNSSYLGASIVAAGSGPAPFKARGNVYLAGPYKGAPVSLVFITPAVAGPYDLGTVVVRVALFIDPETAEVHAVSDRIPDVFGGVKLSIQGISIGLERPKFTVNPTTCREPFPIHSRIFGGGGDPAQAAQWQSVETQYPFRANECGKLKFKPKFFARIFGGKNQTKRGQNPKFRAVLDAREGDANLRRAAFILPRATILDQSHIKTICTRVQLAANECPKNAIYGNARATSPLLDKPLKGPVYLTSSSNELPDLLVDLKGQVPIRLRGVISGKNARLKTVFNGTPDVAVDRFGLTIKGANKGLLSNSRNLCAAQTNGFLNLLAQNSRRMRTKSLRLNIPACRG